MKHRKGLPGNRGFALLIVFMIMSAVTIGLVMLTSNAFKGERTSKNVVTIDRMNTVAEALKKYYLGHHELPDPQDTNPKETVPVAELSLSTKYRFDGWGKFLSYNYDYNSDFKLRDLGEKDDNFFAAIIISCGPDQTIQTTTSEDSDGRLIYEKKDDDILVSVNLQSEAIGIATNTLHVLARKTCSYIFSHDNVTGWDIDDHMDPLDAFLLEFDLSPVFHKIDPWENNYQWLSGSSSFISYGPDGTSDTADDIIVVARTSDCGGTDDNPFENGSLLGYITFESDQKVGNNIHMKAPYSNANILGHDAFDFVDSFLLQFRSVGDCS